MTRLRASRLILGLGWSLGPTAIDAALAASPTIPVPAATEHVPGRVKGAAAQLQAACRQWPATDDFKTSKGSPMPAPMSDASLDDRTLCDDATGKGFLLTHGVIIAILAAAFFALAGMAAVLISIGRLLRSWFWRFNDWRGGPSYP